MAEREHAVCGAKAALAAATAAAPTATPVEQALVEALHDRYPDDPDTPSFAPFHDAFATAMRAVHARFPRDLDVASLLAEALMNRTPWQLWDLATGLPATGADTLEAQSVLEAAFGSLPGAWDHPRLLHMYIHLMEMSPHPEVALRHGDRLAKLVPDAGHLIHMATHIDVLCGDYQNVVARNTRAIVADRKFLERDGHDHFYSVYRCHNYHFKIYGAMFLAQPEPALEAADELIATLPETILRPLADWFEGFIPMKQHVLVRFGMWEAILAARDRVPETRMLFNNTCRDILRVAEAMLLGELAYRQVDHETAFAQLRRSVELDDTLPYDEPWGWMQPTRHALGALLMEQGRFEEAEAVYRADLGLDATLSRACQHPQNVWSLHGLHECLTRRGEQIEAHHVRQQLDRALVRAEVPVRASCFSRGAVAA